MLLACLLLYSCGNDPLGIKRQKKWAITLDKEDKNPYGTYLAYQSLPSYFPGAKIETIPRMFRYTNMDNEMKYNNSGTSLLVLLGLNFYVTEQEWKQLLKFADNGNEVLIFCSRLDQRIAKRLKLNKEVSGYEELPLSNKNEGYENIEILSFKSDSGVSYGYDGRSIQGDFITNLREDDFSDDYDKQVTDSIDIAISPDTLGLKLSKPDFIRYKVGSGHITLHAAPLVMSNYFLLQDHNKKYLDGIWSTLPGGINHIYWNEYYKRESRASGLGVLWRYPATRWAIIIGIVTLLLFILFESKRRQRIIPIIAPPQNSSVSFAETVGRLYYNKGNHSNLEEKIINHFLEWVRTRYYLNTNQLNEDFIHKLAARSGQAVAVARRTVEMIHEVRTGMAAKDEAYLYELYKTVQLFYTNNKS